MDATLGAGSRTLEVRWIRRGRVPQEMLAWLAPSEEEIEEREDRYLVLPSPDLGVKIKGGIQLDLKTLRGTPGELTLPCGSRGRLEIWEKWTFPLDGNALPPPDAPGWLALGKVRHRRSFRIVGRRALERPVSDAELPGCTVELTGCTVEGEPWWTLGLEACGRPETLEPALRATVEVLFADPMPAGPSLALDDSMSYAAWLGTGRERRSAR